MLQLVSLRTKTLNLRKRCARGPVDSQGPVDLGGLPPRAYSCARAVIGAHGNLHLDCDDLILARVGTLPRPFPKNEGEVKEEKRGLIVSSGAMSFH